MKISVPGYYMALKMTLKMKAAKSFESPQTNYQPKKFHIRED